MTKGEELKSVSSEGRKYLSHGNCSCLSAEFIWFVKIYYLFSKFYLETNTENIESSEAPCPKLKIIKSDFESLPGYMKGLSSWEVCGPS